MELRVKKRVNSRGPTVSSQYIMHVTKTKYGPLMKLESLGCLRRHMVVRLGATQLWVFLNPSSS